MGLIHLARGEDDAALESFERENALEASGHLYARECCANTWYAIGALKRRQGKLDDARQAFQQAIARVDQHPLARLGLSTLNSALFAGAAQRAQAASVDTALAGAVMMVLADKHDDAARLMNDALASAPPGNAGWLLPLEPLLHVTSHPNIWAPALARLRTRAA
jgi:tetratricopeptide (TPR) repeat protein